MSTIDHEERARRAAQRQLDAYNAHDTESFAACYHPEVEIFDLKTGELTMSGRDALHQAYGEMFEAFPEVLARVTSRTVVGNVAFDRETVTGRGGEPLEVMAVYEVDGDELIRRVWFVR